VSYLLGLPVSENSQDILVVEVDHDEIPDGLVLASSESGKITDRARITLEESLEKLKPSLAKIVHLLKELSPHEAAVEFGLKVGGETGVIVAKGTAEVNFTVHLTWKSK
jgi:Trypsin-co-occurring domain 1